MSTYALLAPGNNRKLYKRVAVGAKLTLPLNRMIDVGRPDSVRIA
jgi:hypothetical protein